jgi:hypothetical protein
MTAPNRHGTATRADSRRALVGLALVAVLLAACGADEPAGTTSVEEPDVVSAAGSTGETTTTTTATTTTEDDAGIPDFVFAVDEVVRFETGATSAAVDGGLILGERSRYVLEATEGQTMTLVVTSVEDNAIFDLYGPGEELLVRESMEASVQLPTTGRYTIIVGGTRGNATYQLVIEIPA